MSLSELGPGRFANVAAGNRQRRVDQELNTLNLVDEEGNILEFGTSVKEVPSSSIAPSTINVGNESVLAPVKLKAVGREPEYVVGGPSFEAISVEKSRAHNEEPQVGTTFAPREKLNSSS